MMCEIILCGILLNIQFHHYVSFVVLKPHLTFTDIPCIEIQAV